MKILNIKIHNFRGLDIECNGLDDKTLFIGQNDSGKSNICSAILKVFTLEKRRKALVSSDSTFGNNMDIEFSFNLDLEGLSREQLGLLQDWLYEEENKYYMDVWMICKYNSDTMQYEDELHFGKIDGDDTIISTSIQNKLDKVLSVVYINPTYDLVSEKKNYFSYKEIKKIENQQALGVSIQNTITDLQRAVREETLFQDVIMDLNDLGDFGLIFDGMKFELSPNIKVESIFNSLDILNFNDNGNQIDYIGDGKSKVLSMILKAKTIDNNKCKIFIVEEPENHLYVLLQKYYLSALLSLSPHQLIITTHSPFIVDFEKINHIFKVSKVYDEDGMLINQLYSFNVDNDDFREFGYLINTEIAEMIYYDTVVLLEGYSEKYFYNMLSIKDENFNKYLTKHRIGLYSIGNVAFQKTKELLNALGIKVYIKTDNDITKVKNSNKYRYTGLKRAYKYLSNVNKNKILTILSITNEEELLDKLTCDEGVLEIPLIEQKMLEIQEICKLDNVLLSEHHEGFEKDFLDYLSVPEENYIEEMKYLKSAKLKNLHEYINENNKDITIKETNKDSILLGFVNINEIFE